LTKIAPPTETLPEAFDVVARTPGGTGGHEFASLLAEVAGESNFKPNALNKSTGAAGPFQFIKSTWLALLKSNGEAAGVKPELVRQIKLDAKGRPQVPAGKALDDLLALRHDPVLAAKMAAKYLDEGKAQLQHSLRRPPTEAEVHMAFLLGPTGAANLIHIAANAPDTPVDQVVGAAASSNKPLFHDHAGQIRTAGDTVAFLAAKYHADRARIAAYATAANPVANSGIDA
jgi:hypothetical protein